MNTSRRNEVPATTQIKPQPDAVRRVREAVISIIEFARTNGVRVEIDTVPREGVPLAMGATDSVIRLWPAREEIGAEIARIDGAGREEIAGDGSGQVLPEVPASAYPPGAAPLPRQLDEKVRYCPGCGHIGAVKSPALTCCSASCGMSLRRWQAEALESMFGQSRLGGHSAAADVCGNCDTALPDGCGGMFLDDGVHCRLNRVGGGS